MRALLVENVHPDAAAILGTAGAQVETIDRALDQRALIAALDGIQLLGIRSKTEVTEAVFDQAPDLLAVGAFCIGTNQVDLGAARERGIAVFNAPFSNTRSVVELALAEIIALTRRLIPKNAGMHAGVWDKSAEAAHEVRGRRLGIVGYGNIGAQLSVLAEALGMSVYFYDTADKLALGNARRCASLDDLLTVADVVTLHVDGRSGNSGMFGAEQFDRMKPGSLFLNLSRGFVVDHRALRENVESGHLAGAAIDVFPHEPAGRGDEFRSELRDLPNVILTPHIAGSTEEAQQDIGRYVAGKLRDYQHDGSTAMSVNLPHLSLPRRSGGCRIAHLHRNVPGVLAKINSLLAEHKVNIDGQLLDTRGEYGYVLTDVALDYPAAVLDSLAALPETVRVRRLG
ncbi:MULTISPECIES: phosphoglycerate dehydrogenase [unclassified Pseudofrankia]|uniref:phosphoglycerate dehydrogenase n=1 Tax=unclassified Pseudofrankia TaxID=2994372 RepID=UPI0008DACC00|nr:MULTISPECIES: phosphoglycerate dehydrogenase [unclassified Pseudofrankia]MDT3442508.1 phosphoglycerate dehydrogenase [Pseudofrankia sp. BMG5.37]OHV74703.1 D-3-phosphoglycerate dehydrogenase [Pseudofrankia sp. BMG5.36]